MNSRRLLGVIVFALFISGTPLSLSAKEKLRVSLGTVYGSGIEQQKLDTVESLLRHELVEHKDVAFEEGAQYEIDAELTKLEHHYIIMLSLAEGNVVERARKAKIDTFDEIDTAIARLVAALIENVPLDETAERGEVFKNEEREPSRVNSIGGWEVFLGAAWPFSDAMLSHRTMFALAGGYMWEIGRALLELRGDTQFGYNRVKMNTSSFTIGGHYVLFEGRQAGLYIGPDIGFARVQDNNGNGKSGFGVAGNAGLILLRHADINLDVRFRTMVVTDKLNGSVPVIGSLLVGLHF